MADVVKEVELRLSWIRATLDPETPVLKRQTQKRSHVTRKQRPEGRGRKLRSVGGPRAWGRQGVPTL